MSDQKRKTGGSNSYYGLDILNTLDGREAYRVECLEVIEALGMTFAEGEAFKAIWRSCAARTLGLIKEDNNALYDAEKVEFYGKRMVVASTHLKGIPTGYVLYTPGAAGPRTGSVVDVMYHSLQVEQDKIVGHFSWEDVKAYRLKPAPAAPLPLSEKAWEKGTMLRYRGESSDFYNYGHEYEIVAVLDRILSIRNSSGNPSSWTTADAKRNFIRA